MTSTIAATRREAPEAIRALTFGPEAEAWTLLSDLSLEQWLEDATRDFALMRVAAALASMSDNDLEASVRSTDELQPWFHLLDGLEPWRQRTRALINLRDAAEARLFVVLARVLDLDPDG